jgi:hypothetical protein
MEPRIGTGNNSKENYSVGCSTRFLRKIEQEWSGRLQLLAIQSLGCCFNLPKQEIGNHALG